MLDSKAIPELRSGGPIVYVTPRLAIASWDEVRAVVVGKLTICWTKGSNSMLNPTRSPTSRARVHGIIRRCRTPDNPPRLASSNISMSINRLSAWNHCHFS